VIVQVQGIRDEHDGVRSLPNDLCHRGAELRRRVGDDAQGNEPQPGASVLGGGPVHGMRRVRFVQDDGDAPRARRNLVKDADQLAEDLFLLGGDAGDVAGRLGQTGDEPASRGIADACHDDRYRLGRPLGARGCCVAGPDHFDSLPDQFAGQGIQAIRGVLCVDESVLDVLPFGPAEIAHSLA
jgi:hypothetical protein